MPAKPPSAQERFERRQARRQVKKVGCLCSLCLFWNVSRVEDGLEMLGIAVYTRAFVIPFAAAPWQVYWSRTQTGWQGGRNLSDSAAYTSLFARALLQCWCRFLSDSMLGYARVFQGVCQNLFMSILCYSTGRYLAFYSKIMFDHQAKQNL